MLLCQSADEKIKDLGRFRGASPVAQRVKNPPAKQEMRVLSWVGKSPPTHPLSLEEGTTAHSSILAWRILWTEELAGGAGRGSSSWGHRESNTTEHTRSQISRTHL